MQHAMQRSGGSIAMPRMAEACVPSISALAMCMGFLFSARAVFVLVSARWLNTGTEPGVLSAFLFSGALLFAALIAAIGRPAQSLSFLLRARPFQWVLAYLAFAACSLLWTASASPASSALYWVSLVIDVVTIVLLFRACPGDVAARSLIVGFVAGTVLLSVIAWIMPDESDLRLGDIDYFNTNQIGNLCASSLLLGPLVARRGSWRWWLTAGFLAVTLLRSLSKSTLIAFVAAQAYRLVRDPAISRRGKWLMVSGTLVALACSWTLLDAYYGVYTTAGNQAETLTGRTAIWAWSIGAALKHPWIGNGFDAMWKVAPPFGGEQFEARHAENELLQQFFAYGVFGVALLVGVYGSLRRSMLRLPRNSAPAFIAVIVYTVVRGLTEAEPFDLLLPVWLIASLAFLIQVRLNGPDFAGTPAFSRGSR
jgi:O-antigen ligase